MVRDSEIADFLKDIRHSLDNLVPALSSIVDMLNVLADDLQEDNSYFPEVQRLEEKMYTILTTTREITRDQPRPLQTQTDRLAFAQF